MWSLGYTGPFAVSCEGRSGGLALFWRQPFSVSLRGANSHAIDVIVDSGEPMAWRATFIYGEPRWEQRHLFWDMLRRLRGEWNGPWICCGDFNEVLVQDEHYGSTDRSEVQMELFRNYLDECNLIDLGFCGPKFTWSNRQDAQCNIRVRLDRAVANNSFSELFPENSVENIITTSSDHFAIRISLLSDLLQSARPPVQQGFWYEAAWRRAEDYGDFVKGFLLSCPRVLSCAQFSPAA
jgi:hypothetical protein